MELSRWDAKEYCWVEETSKVAASFGLDVGAWDLADQAVLEYFVQCCLVYSVAERMLVFAMQPDLEAVP